MRHPGGAGRAGRPELPAGQRPDGAVSQAYGVYQAAAARRGAGPVHHRSRGAGPVPGRARPERRPAEPGGPAGAHRPPVGRALPRGLDARPVDASTRSPPCGRGISSRTTWSRRDRLGDVRPGLPGARPPARPAGGAQGLQAGLPGHAQHRAGRGPLGRRAQSSQRLHDLRGGRHGRECRSSPWSTCPARRSRP